MREKEKISDKQHKNELMPLLFLGHGSPMNAIEENEFVKGFRKTAETLPKPVAILCISAHWFVRGTYVTAMQTPRTIHDFGGFPRELYEIQYLALGSPELAAEIKQMVRKTNVGLDNSWGLDHGTWSVLRHLYPKAEIPVVQLSIDYTKPALYHFELAKELYPLREKGVLIIGSGNIIHNLGLVDYSNFDKENYGYNWAIKAHEIINTYILNENFRELVNYETLGNEVNQSVPSPDHYVPLLYVLALKNEGEKIRLFNDKMVGGSMSMTSARID
jgi:4,5-DOPA dioxygenase extradiol